MSINNKPVKHAADSLLPDWMLANRTRVLTSEGTEPKEGQSVVYWMQRDVRSVDNWALLWARDLAMQHDVPLHVVYALPPPASSDGSDNDRDLPPALIQLPMTKRHGAFLLGGLECVYKELKEMKIPLYVCLPDSHEKVGETVCEAIQHKYKAKIVVSDFSPIREYRQWMELQAVPILEEAKVPFYQVDAHNIVPVWTATDKRQVGARTLRPRIHKVYNDYLQDYPDLKGNSHSVDQPKFDRVEYESFLQMDESVESVDWAQPGTEAGMKQFEFFSKNGLKIFHEQRNDPVQKHVCSNMSPWINHGHISFQRLALNVKALNKHANGTAAFIEEGVIRRELSDNMLYYSPNDYDSLETAAGWARESLQLHASDEREFVYSLSELEEGRTHDDLWNAAQLQMVRDGKMHGFMRMYWAKKILEWSESPVGALRTAQYLNDKYELDGRDPNGFVGVGWSIMGIHDQGWKEREVFGKIRYMNYNGCKRKFKVEEYVAQYKGAAENAANAVEETNGSSNKRKSLPSSSNSKQKTARK
jgi:deoxyribodipyrimidine photo-lyase